MSAPRAQSQLANVQVSIQEPEFRFEDENGDEEE
jgi:hypothetical protein